jgi:hypothetical protein
MDSTGTSAVSDDARAVAWWVLVGVGSGAIAGFVVGGIGGRLAMLLLRLTSPDLVLGMSSDDGFEIGVVSTDTFNLLAAMTFVGAANGLVYAALRTAVPRRLRMLLWTLLAAAAGGASFVHEDGVDFTLLEPAALAVVLFVALPGLAAAVVVVLVERWVDVDPASNRRLVGVLLVAAVAATLALVLAAVVGAVAVLARRVGAVELFRPVSRIAVPFILVTATLVAAVDLITEASRII